MLVLEGRGAEYESEVPFGILVDALDEYLAGLDGARLERVAGDAAADLGAVFPSLRGASGRRRALPRRTARCAGLLERLPAGRGAAAGPRRRALGRRSLRRGARARAAQAASARPRARARAPLAPGPRAHGRGARGRRPARPRRAHRARAARRVRRRRAAAGGNRRRAARTGSARSAAATRSTSSSSPGPAKPRPGRAAGPAPDDLAVPGAVIAALSVELDGLPPAARRLLERGRAGRASRSSSTSRSRSRSRPPPPRWTRSTCCSRATWSGRPTCRGGCASVTRSCAGPSTSRRGWAGGSPRTRAPRRRWRRAARRRRCSRATSSRRPRPATSAPSRVLAEAGEAAATRAPAAAGHWFAAALRLLPEGAEPARRVALLAPWAFNRAVTGRLEESRDGDGGGARRAARGRARGAHEDHELLRRDRALPRPP